MVHHAAHFILDRAGNHLAAGEAEKLCKLSTQEALLNVSIQPGQSHAALKHLGTTQRWRQCYSCEVFKARQTGAVSVRRRTKLSVTGWRAHQECVHTPPRPDAQSHTVRVSEPCRLWNNTGPKLYHSCVSTMLPLKQHRPKIIPLTHLNHATAETLHLQAQNHTVCMSEWYYLRNNKGVKLGFNAQLTMTVTCWWTETTQKRNLVLMPNQPW